MKPADERQRLRSRVAALEQLLEVHERTALEFADRLELERARLFDFLNQAPAAIGVIEGEDLRLTFTNEDFVKTVGGRDLVGMSIREAFPELEGQGFIELLEQVIATGEPVHASATRVLLDFSGDGTLEERFYDFIYEPMRREDGTVSGVMSFAVDVTEQVTARQQLEALVEDLGQLNDASIRLNQALSVDAILEGVADEVMAILPAKGVEVSIDIGDGPVRTVRGEPRGAQDLVSSSLTDRDGRPTGWVDLTTDPDRWTPNDELVLTQLARIASVAVQNAGAYEREHRIAEVLQRSLLPEEIPQVPGLQIAYRYVPGGAATRVGGDWYDVIYFEDDTVTIALGDVGGRGVRAAAAMGQIRMALRTHAFAGSGPAESLLQTDRVLHGSRLDQMATVLLGRLDLASGSLVVSAAGHPPPVMYDGQRATLLEVATSVPLGVVPDATYDEDTMVVPPGGLLVLYSDGLVERRGELLDIGFERLRTAVEQGPDDIEALCDHLLDALIEDERPDDVALLVVRRD